MSTNIAERTDGRPQARPHLFPELVRSVDRTHPLFTLETLGDLPFTIDAPLGALEIDIRGILELRLGSVLQLDRLTGEPLEIVVNGTPIARGEVRIQGERFAIRVTEILRSDAREETGGGADRDETTREGGGARGADGGDSRARAGR